MGIVTVHAGAGVEVRNDEGHWIATFTDGAYSVRLAGPSRTFAEPTAQRIVHRIWVRALPVPFAGHVDKEWLSRALLANTSNTADILAIAMQYIAGAPPLCEGGLQIAGDASYGPPAGRTREEGSDFYDYLGIEWTDPDGRTHQPREDQLHCLDCSGFIRMIWGYRHNLPDAAVSDRISLGWKPKTGALPRRAVQMCDHGPGVQIIANEGTPPRRLDELKVGDLVFFDADPKDGDAIDHVGMYLGRDARRHHRFVSSRKSADGPTFGDFRHSSILDGETETDLYTRSFRAARRL
jgi:cell wall-associated NlpC family hydrolase